MQGELGAPGDQHGVEEGGKKSAGHGIGLEGLVLTDDLLFDCGQPFTRITGATAGILAECRGVLFVEQFLGIVDAGE